MRTTVTIDPDVHALLRKTMRQRGEPFKPIVVSRVHDAHREDGPLAL